MNLFTRFSLKKLKYHFPLNFNLNLLCSSTSNSMDAYAVVTLKFWKLNLGRYGQNNWKFHVMVLADRKLEMHEIVEVKARSHGPVVSTSNDQFSLRKLSVKWVPRLLTSGFKRRRMTNSIECLVLFYRNSDENMGNQPAVGKMRCSKQISAEER